MIGKRIEIEIDRPLGSTHPKHKNIVYSINYGFATGVIGGDGEEQDVYLLGVDTPVERYTGTVIAVIHRKNDNEDKWVAAPEGKTFTEEEIRRATHFQEQYFDIEIVM